MTTVTFLPTLDQGAIANSFLIAQNKLFASTSQAIDFWLEVLRNKEKLPKKEYSEYLNSFGWSNRDASPYVRMADFIRSNFLDHLDAIAKLDIRTLIKLPRIRYASIVEAIKEFAPTQKQVSDLVKKLPPVKRGYKSAEQKKDEVFEVNVPAATGAVITEAAELLGFTKQRLIKLGAELVKAIAVGDQGLADLTDLIEQIQVSVAKKTIVDDEDSEYLPDVVQEAAYVDTLGEIEVETTISSSFARLTDTWDQAQSELAVYIDEQQNREVQILADRVHRIADLTARLQKVDDAIAQLEESGHENDSLMMGSARRQKELFVQDLKMSKLNR